MTNKTCSCGSTQSLDQCCQPYLRGDRLPATPEALMRSRYTAYTQANIAYIQETMQGPAARGYDPESARQWAAEATWLGLEVMHAPPVPLGNTVGFVEFVARYQLKNREHQLHEVSEFHFLDGRWVYVNGTRP